jgi:hypothetical protein
MQRFYILFITFLTVFTFSCKKSSNNSEVAAVADYYNLQVGNYWIYQWYTINNSDTAFQTQLDSAYIEKDTVIRGYTYYKLMSNPSILNPDQFPSYLRDSSGFLVLSTGIKICSNSDFKDTLYIDTRENPYFRFYETMTGKDSIVTIPLGNFQSITSHTRVVPVETGQFPIRYIYDVYAKNLGKIKSHNFYVNGGEQIESRLVRMKMKWI